MKTIKKIKEKESLKGDETDVRLLSSFCVTAM